MKKTLALFGITIISAAVLAIIVFVIIPAKPGAAVAQNNASDRDSYVVAASNRLAMKSSSAPAVFPHKPSDLKLYTMDQALTEAKKTDKYVLVYFWTSWCSNCEIFNSQVIPNPEVLKNLKESYLFVSIDGDNDPDKLGRIFRVRGFPTIFILKADGEPALVIPGRVPADIFAHVLSYISSGANETMEFDEYEASLEKASKS
ncbi:MAG: thioredoxin family protein [Deltaproteobacteria bacterium]|nr:thioredoxin family protein [Deltaproteobacteria bacterium]